MKSICANLFSIIEISFMWNFFIPDIIPIIINVNGKNLNIFINVFVQVVLLTKGL